MNLEIICYVSFCVLREGDILEQLIIKIYRQLAYTFCVLTVAKVLCMRLQVVALTTEWFRILTNN
jgi:hypothetical protein